MKYKNEIEIYGDNRFAKATRFLSSCRALIINENKEILLIYESSYDKYMMPGCENNVYQTSEETLLCEIERLTGFSIKVDSPYVDLKEYYREVEFTTHYFFCSIENEYGYKSLTANEEKAGYKNVWMPLKEAIKIFSKYNEYRYTNEEKRGRYLREYKALTFKKLS